MDVREEIERYVAGQPEPKQGDLRALHALVLRMLPSGRLWFLDGRNEAGKIVSNPNIGYGSRVIDYADGSSREFYQIGLSANTAGISVYILGIADRTYLAETFGARLGKARVTGYCIRFKALKDIDIGVLEAVMRHGIESREP
ncbi:DUF1801 domain-containing protein [Sphingomonas sp. KR3-1]|uniref:DUF1801 domain-containing protein n=1 Tax=Sphingomonas sp. KR3-1 TaxID=3156611 RepID=UPI0032B49ADC